MTSFFINRAVDERSFLTFDGERITIYKKLAGKYIKAHAWLLATLIPQFKSLPKDVFVHATNKYVLLFAGSQKKSLLVVISMMSGLLRGHLTPVSGKLIHCEVQEGDGLVIRAVDANGNSIRLALQPETLDLLGPIDVVPNGVGSIEDARVLQCGLDGVVQALLGKELIVSQVIPSEQVTRSHKLSNIQQLIMLWESMVHYFLLAKDADGHLLVCQFSKETFELLNSWTLFSVPEKAFVHAHVLDDKVVIVSSNSGGISVNILDLNSMNVLNLISEDPLNLTDIKDCVVTKGLNIYLLSGSASVTLYSGLAARNTWKMQSVKERFEFNHWFNVLLPSPSLETRAIECFPWTSNKTFGNWNELRVAVDALVEAENYKAMALLVKLTGGDVDKFCKEYSIVRMDRLEVQAAVAIHEGAPLTPLLPVMPWAWLSSIYKSCKSRTQIDQLANYLLFSEVPAGADAAEIIIASDIEPSLILDYAQRQKCLPLFVTSLPAKTILNASLSNRELSAILPLVDPKVRFHLLFNRYLYPEALYSYQNEGKSGELDFFVENLVKAIPDLQAKPFAAVPQLYPELPQFTLSPTVNTSDAQPATQHHNGKESRKSAVTFAPSPHRDSIKSPPLHGRPMHSPEKVSLSPSKFPVRLATPRHHSAIQPSKLSQHTMLELSPSTSMETSPSKRRRLRTPSPARKAEQESPRAKSPSKSPRKTVEKKKQSPAKKSSPEKAKSSSPGKVVESPIRRRGRRERGEVGFIEKDVMEFPRKHKAPEHYSPSPSKKRMRSPSPTKGKSPARISPRRRIFEDEEVEASPEPILTNVTTKRKRTLKPSAFTTTSLSSPKKASTPKKVTSPKKISTLKKVSSPKKTSTPKKVSSPKKSDVSSASTPKRQMKKLIEESIELRQSPRLKSKKK